MQCIVSRDFLLYPNSFAWFQLQTFTHKAHPVLVALASPHPQITQRGFRLCLFWRLLQGIKSEYPPCGFWFMIGLRHIWAKKLAESVCLQRWCRSSFRLTLCEGCRGQKGRGASWTDMDACKGLTQPSCLKATWRSCSVHSFEKAGIRTSNGIKVIIYYMMPDVTCKRLPSLVCRVKFNMRQQQKKWRKTEEDYVVVSIACAEQSCL